MRPPNSGRHGRVVACRPWWPEIVRDWPSKVSCVGAGSLCWQDHEPGTQPTVQNRNLIAVVDDDPSMLESVGQLLEAYGFDTKLFSSAEACRTQCGAIGAACLILDVNLPGMSGIDLRRELLRAGISVPVIFMTGNDSEATMRSVAEVGCVACLQKPFRAPALLEAINRAVGSTPPRKMTPGTDR